jgi:hypothetical protein
MGEGGNRTMRMSIVVAMVLGLLACGVVFAADERISEQDIDKLAESLSSDDPSAREAATEKLISLAFATESRKLVEKKFTPLENAPDPEVKMRAGRVLDAVRLQNQIDRLIAEQGDLWFAMHALSSEEKMGWGHLKTEAGEKDGVPIVVFKDEFANTSEETATVEAYCRRDSLLTPIFLKLEWVIKGAEFSIEVRFGDKIALKTTRMEKVKEAFGAKSEDYAKQIYNRNLDNVEGLVLRAALPRLAVLDSFKKLLSDKSRELTCFILPEDKPLKKRSWTIGKGNVAVDGKQKEVDLIAGVAVEDGKVVQVDHHYAPTDKRGSLRRVKTEEEAKAK